MSRYLDQTDKGFIIVLFLIVAAAIVAVCHKLDDLDDRLKRLEPITAEAKK